MAFAPSVQGETMVRSDRNRPGPIRSVHGPLFETPGLLNRAERRERHIGSPRLSMRAWPSRGGRTRADHLDSATVPGVMFRSPSRVDRVQRGTETKYRTLVEQIPAVRSRSTSRRTPPTSSCWRRTSASSPTRWWRGRIFSNTIKYVLMGTSSNFGNMFSAAAASAFPPFLPMLPSQILLNNLLYDAGEMTIPTDNVDEEQLERPSRWDIRSIETLLAGVRAGQLAIRLRRLRAHAGRLPFRR